MKRLVVAGLAAAASPARADVGFMVEPAASLSTSIEANPASMMAALPKVSSPFVPVARAGVDLGAVAVLFDFSYTTETIASADIYFVTLGVDVMPRLWTSDDHKVELYGNLGPYLSRSSYPTTMMTATTAGGGARLAVGARYFVHPSFAVGFELGDQLEVDSLANETSLANSTFAAMSATFTTNVRN